MGHDVDARMNPLTEMILNAYREGIFPMAESADDEEFAFFEPHMRAIVPLESIHISGSLLKFLKKTPYRVTLNQAFDDIIEGCAERDSTWINVPIRSIYKQLHRQGHAHSVECWDKDGKLAGGLYGIAIGAVFCGESMVSFQTNASKVALVHLCALLKTCGYKILDSQFINDHMAQFGTYEIPQDDYVAKIQTAMNEQPTRLADVPITHDLLIGYLAARAKTPVQ